MERLRKTRRVTIGNWEISNAEALHTQLTKIASDNGVALKDLELDLDEYSLEVGFFSLETDAEVQVRVIKELKDKKAAEAKEKREQDKIVDMIKKNRNDPAFKKLIKDAGILELADFVSPPKPLVKKGCGRPGHPYDCGTMNEYSGCMDSNADQ